MASWLWDTVNRPGEAFQTFLIAMTTMIIVWFISLLYKLNRVTPCLPPGPRGLPFVGYLPFLGANLHHTFTELASTYGPIFKVRLGTKHCIVISSPSLIKEALFDQDVNFANRDPPIASKIITFGASDIAFSNYGHDWRKMRKIFSSEMLSKSNLDSSYYLRKQQVKKMIADTYEKAGQVVNVGDLAFLAIMNSMVSMVLGRTVKGSQSCTINSDFRDVVGELMELLGILNISDFFPVLARFDIQGVARRAKTVNLRCEEILDSAINIHYNEEIDLQKDFLGYLLQLTKHEDPATSLTLTQVKALLLDVMIAGMDTTVTTVEWAMALMLQHPNVMKVVQEELTKIVGLNSSIEESHLSELKYLKAVVKETLRLHPSVPLLVPHCPSQSAILGGYTIPKGAQVIFNIFAIQRDPHLWEDPLEFRPDRFLKGSLFGDPELDYGGNHLQYLPFGSGRRTCPGIPLAERTSMHVLASLLHAFEWSLPDGVKGVDLSERFGIVVKMSKPLLAVPCPRLSSSEIYSYSDE